MVRGGRIYINSHLSIKYKTDGLFVGLKGEPMSGKLNLDVELGCRHTNALSNKKAVTVSNYC
jgi:hypothetical protein